VTVIAVVALAQRHRRYGVGMIHLKLRQAGEIINYKRVERLYGLEKLRIRRRRRKKIPLSDRQPIVRPGRGNEIWSKDFVLGSGILRRLSGPIRRFHADSCLGSRVLPLLRPALAGQVTFHLQRRNTDTSKALLVRS
jgi:hypothetical protein